MPVAEWTERLREVIEVLFADNVLAAAKVAGLDASNLSRLRDGRVSDPRLATMRKLADAYAIPLAWLLGDDDLLPEEAERGHSPRWLVIIDRFQDAQQREARALLTPEELKSDEIIEFDRFRAAGEDAALNLLGKAEMAEPKATKRPRELALYRDVREVETKVLWYVVDKLRAKRKNKR
jgi:transcriptional regulator with XRE-family HTH domain